MMDDNTKRAMSHPLSPSALKPQDTQALMSLSVFDFVLLPMVKTLTRAFRDRDDKNQSAKVLAGLDTDQFASQVKTFLTSVLPADVKLPDDFDAKVKSALDVLTNLVAFAQKDENRKVLEVLMDLFSKIK